VSHWDRQKTPRTDQVQGVSEGEHTFSHTDPLYHRAETSVKGSERNRMDNLHGYFAQVNEALRTINVGAARVLVTTLTKARRIGATVFTCGNGGSASAASHLAQDLGKGAVKVGLPNIRTVCLCDNVSAITAWANDEGYERVFSSQLLTLGESDDILIAISGSGNSPNVLGAVCVANTMGMRTWGITGFDGGELINTAHRCIHVKSDDMGVVESAHGVLFHWLVEALKGKETSPNSAPTWCPEREPV